MNATRSFGKVIRTLGLMGIMMALAGFMATATTPASATEIIGNPTGKLTVHVPASPSPSTTSHALVVIADDAGNKFVETQVALGSSYSTYLVPGVYKVYVTVSNGSEFSQVAEVKDGQHTSVKASFAAPTSRLSRGR